MLEFWDTYGPDSEGLVNLPAVREKARTLNSVQAKMKRMLDQRKKDRTRPKMTKMARVGDYHRSSYTSYTPKPSLPNRIQAQLIAQSTGFDSGEDSAPASPFQHEINELSQTIDKDAMMWDHYPDGDIIGAYYLSVPIDELPVMPTGDSYLS